MNHQHASEAACDDTVLRCASKVTPAFSPDGTLWLAWMAGGADIGGEFEGRRPQLFGAGSRYQGAPQPGLGNRCAAPKSFVDRQWRHRPWRSRSFRDKAFNGQVLYTRSSDGGKSFSELRPITSSNESQRFEALGLDADGSVFAAGSTSATAFRRPGGSENTTAPVCSLRRRTTAARAIPKPGLAQDNTCECCRLGLAFAGPGRPVVVFRNIFDAAFGITRS